MMNHSNAHRWNELHKVTFADLETYIFVVDLGTFTAAAAELEISQPAVTQRIRRLEKATGARLIERGRGRAEPTDAGKRLLDGLPPALDSLAEVLRAASSNADTIGTSLIIASTPFIASTQLPRLVRSFTNRHNATVAIRDLSYTDTLQAIDSGAAHLAILADVREPQSTSQHIGNIDVVLAAHPSHPLSGEKTVTIEQLDQHEIFLNHQYLHLLEKIEEHARDHGMTTPLRRHLVQEMGTVIGMVNAAMGLALVTRTVAETFCAPKTATIEIEGLPMRRQYTLLISERPAPESIKIEFIEHIRKHFRRDYPLDGR